MPETNEDKLRGLLNELATSVEPVSRWSSVRDRVSELTTSVPALPEDAAPTVVEFDSRPPASRVRLAILVGVAAVAVVGAVVAIRSTDSSPSIAGPVTGSTSNSEHPASAAPSSVEMPFYLPTGLPAGLELGAATRGPLSLSNPTGPVTVLTNTDDTAQFTMAAFSFAPPSSSDQTGGLVTTLCDGQKVETVAGSGCITHFSADVSVLLAINGKRQLSISGTGRVSDADLQALASGALWRDATSPAMSVHAPSGFVVRYTGTLPSNSDGWRATYAAALDPQHPENGFRSIELSVTDRQPDPTIAEGWHVNAGSPVDVQGHPGRVVEMSAGTSGRPTTTSVRWSVGSNIEVTVDGTGVSKDEVIRLANTLRPVDEPTWTTAVRDHLEDQRALGTSSPATDPGSVSPTFAPSSGPVLPLPAPGTTPEALKATAIAWAKAFLVGSLDDISALQGPECTNDTGTTLPVQIRVGYLAAERAAMEKHAGRPLDQIHIVGVTVRDVTGTTGDALVEYDLPDSVVGNDNWVSFTIHDGRWKVSNCHAPIGGQGAATTATITNPSP